MLIFEKNSNSSIEVALKLNFSQTADVSTLLSQLS